MNIPSPEVEGFFESCEVNSLTKQEATIEGWYEGSRIKEQASFHPAPKGARLPSRRVKFYMTRSPQNVKSRAPRANIAIKIVKATGGEVCLEDLGLDQRTVDKIRLKQGVFRSKRLSPFYSFLRN